MGVAKDHFDLDLSLGFSELQHSHLQVGADCCCSCDSLDGSVLAFCCAFTEQLSTEAAVRDKQVSVASINQLQLGQQQHAEAYLAWGH